jgi:hypothetical protein
MIWLTTTYAFEFVQQTLNAFDISSEQTPRNLDIHPNNVHNIQLR